MHPNRKSFQLKLCAVGWLMLSTYVPDAHISMSLASPSRMHAGSAAI